MDINENQIINPNEIYAPLPISKQIIPQKTHWVKIEVGNGISKCFHEDQIDKFGFDSWKQQAKDKSLKNKFGSCQACGSSTCNTCNCSQSCSQQCPVVSQDNCFYKLGPQIPASAYGQIETQPYTMPLIPAIPCPYKINYTEQWYLGPP